jgi:anti-sigma B factor antagonist
MSQADTHLVVAVSGELDIASAPKLERELTAEWAESVIELTLDLSGIEFMDSSGLHALERVCRHRQSFGKETRLVRIPRQAARLFLVAAAYRDIAALPEPVR